MEKDLLQQIQKDAAKLHTTADIAPLVQASSGARFVLLGEASHGTSEFYSLRAHISKKLITDHGFRFIAVEGDWPACYAVNQYIKGSLSGPRSLQEAMGAFKRWPQWMWANEEVAGLLEWLKSYNDQLERYTDKVGFYGIDVYSLWESLEEIIHYLERRNSPSLEQAKRAIACFEAYQKDEQAYAVEAGLLGEHDCEDEVVELLTMLRRKDRLLQSKTQDDPENALSAEINALTAVNADHYYRTMIKGDAQSWNVRDRHMAEALYTVAEAYGDSARGIVWEHNTHIGDARATDMVREGMVNVGQLMKRFTRCRLLQAFRKRRLSRIF